MKNFILFTFIFVILLSSCSLDGPGNDARSIVAEERMSLVQMYEQLNRFGGNKDATDEDLRQDFAAGVLELYMDPAAESQAQAYLNKRLTVDQFAQRFSLWYLLSHDLARIEYTEGPDGNKGVYYVYNDAEPGGTLIPKTGEFVPNGYILPGPFDAFIAPALVKIEKHARDNARAIFNTVYHRNYVYPYWPFMQQTR